MYKYAAVLFSFFFVFVVIIPVFVAGIWCKLSFMAGALTFGTGILLTLLAIRSLVDDPTPSG